MTAYISDREINVKVARLLGMKVSEVSLVTEAFIKEVSNLLVKDKRVLLFGLGSMKVTCRSGLRPSTEVLNRVRGGRVVGKATLKVKKKYFVSFKKSQALARAIRNAKGRAEVLEEDNGR